jgi:hypothetical protein
MYADLQVCFVLDYHEPVDKGALRDQIHDIISDVQNQYPRKSISVAFVGYGGCFCVPYTTVYQWTHNVKYMQKQLNVLEPKYIFTDKCRNVQQAYGLVNDLQWYAKRRIIIHMGDGPAFGPKYHDPNIYDAYPGGHPYLVLEEEVEKFATKQIELVLLKIDNSWDKMTQVIKDSYLYWNQNGGIYIEDLTNKQNLLRGAIYDEVKKHILRQLV